VENHISLRENLIIDAEATPEAIFAKYFYSENKDSAVIVPSPNGSPTAESEQKKTDNEKIVQFPNLKPSVDLIVQFPEFQFRLGDIKQIVRLEKPYFEKCGKCEHKAMLYWNLQTFQGDWADLCEECGSELQKEKQREV
jgi:DNA-directed RNA polymerase subunit M/transcription elongation factor TFIIS